MKASEVLQRYQAGEGDFKNVNLRGQSFRKDNLADADFSYADIRGANFAQANLTGAKFTKAKAGLQKRWAIALLIFALLLIVLSAFLTAFACILVNLIVNAKSIEYVIGGYVALVILGLCYFLLFHKGISDGGLVLPIVVPTIAITIVLF